MLALLVALVLLPVVLLAGCSAGDDSPDEPSPAPAPAPAASTGVSGEYDTAVELVDSTCSGITVMDNPTTVEQDGDSVTLIHAGVSYVGPLREDGRFATAQAQVPVGADVHALAVSGTFGDDGFEARVVAEVTGTQTCGYTVTWTGTRQE